TRDAHNLRAVAAWIEDHQEERWFVFLHSYVAHQYQAPEQDLARFRDPRKGLTGGDPVSYLDAEGWLANPPSPSQIEELSDRYDASIHFADRSLAALFARLEQGGLLENTLVVLTSDHGEEFWDHGSLAHSITLYEEMLEVPLIIRLPGGGPARTIAEPVSQADLTPTLLDLLNLPPIEQLDGHSRAGLVRGDSPAGPSTPLYANVASPQSHRSSLQVGTLKIIRGETSPRVKRPAPYEWQLFDLKQDPRELEDLSGRRSDQLLQMQQSLAQYEAYLAERALVGSRAEINPDLLRQLEELGY
ncbi:MAG: sulfatase-like hydrolase/transferase, partial [Planctomycetota bacterium]